MAAFTNQGEALVLNYLMTNTAFIVNGVGGNGETWTPAATEPAAAGDKDQQGLWIGLFTNAASPGENGTAGTEVSGTGYERKFIPFTALASGDVSSSTDAAVGTMIQGPSADITWTAGADWATGSTTVAHFGLFLGNASTAVMLIYGQLTNAKNVANGDTVKLSANDLDITLK